MTTLEQSLLSLLNCCSCGRTFRRHWLVLDVTICTAALPTCEVGGWIQPHEELFSEARLNDSAVWYRARKATATPTAVTHLLETVAGETQAAPALASGVIKTISHLKSGVLCHSRHNMRGQRGSTSETRWGIFQIYSAAVSISVRTKLIKVPFELILASNCNALLSLYPIQLQHSREFYWLHLYWEDKSDWHLFSLAGDSTQHCYIEMTCL